MKAVFSPAALRGELPAIPSKSDAHRALICAALADAPTRLVMPDWPANDIQATIRCLNALGAKIARTDGALVVQPIQPSPKCAELNCGESGSTLRFLLPVAAALGRETRFTGEGRLPDRPIGPLLDCLRAGGITIEGNLLPLHLSGQLQSGEYRLPGDVSSQFISGFLLALPLLPEGGEIRLSGPLQSAPYVEMTLQTFARFSIQVEQLPDGWRIPAGQRYRSPDVFEIEGDWSNMAFFLAAGALCGPVTCTGLSRDSLQGDREILNLLRRFGASVEESDGRVTVSPAPLRAVHADISQTPDLAPILAVVAAVVQGESVFTGAGRLRIKETDRLQTVTAMLRALGAHVIEGEDSFRVIGQPMLREGNADGTGDHRISMAAAIAATVCEGQVTLTGAESVEKSYPSFYQDYVKLGGKCDVVDDR